MKTRKFRVGLIGGGGIAQAVHIPGWRNLPEVEIVGIADVSEATAKKAAEAAGGGPFPLLPQRQKPRPVDPRFPGPGILLTLGLPAVYS